MKYFTMHRERHLELIAKSFSEKDKGNGIFKGIGYPFVFNFLHT